MKSLSHARLFATPWIVACTKLLRPCDFQGKSTGVGCHFFLQRIFPTQGSNPGLSHCRQTLYHLSHQGRVSIVQFSSVQSLSPVWFCNPANHSTPGLPVQLLLLCILKKNYKALEHCWPFRCTDLCSSWEEKTNKQRNKKQEPKCNPFLLLLFLPN